VRFTVGFLMDSVKMTREVINGEASLGGSESAMLGLARALKARGHDVRIFASRLDPDCACPDQHGVVWHDLPSLPEVNQGIEFDVFVVLRTYPHLAHYQPKARLTLLWHQDLLTVPKALMSVVWAVDRHVYVSDYQRQQYEDLLPELVGQGWVTKNGFDASLVPADVVKDPNRIIHISRPERGLKPLLQMWPAVKQANPDAVLALCRYQSMYDSEGSNVKATCEMFDRVVERLNNEVGGIEWLGHLGKRDLYREIAKAAVMWYPGIAGFAETSCIAAIESQANGTPFVGSYKGALPETVPSGVLLTGDAEADEAYRADSVKAVLEIMGGCRAQSFAYRKAQKAGLQHVAAYTYDVIAGEWEAFIEQTFRQRYESHKPAILRALDHYDDLAVARHVASELGDDAFVAMCDAVGRGEDMTSTDYSDRALDPAVEITYEGAGPGGRFYEASEYLEACTQILDVACGNGSFAISTAKRYPHVRIVGLDYSPGNIEAARAAAVVEGVADRVTFLEAAVWDLPYGRPAVLSASVRETLAGYQFDGGFVGEFLEHVVDCAGLVDHVETFLQPGALVVYTCPSGPFIELLERGTPKKRGHVHHFSGDDLANVFGQKLGFGVQFLDRGITRRGRQIGHWILVYRTEPGRTAGQRDVVHRALTTRPLPRLSVGLIAYNAALDLGKCLDQVYPIADEILVGDTGSTDATAAIAAEFGARVIALPNVADIEDGFAGARNAVLREASGDWFLWIDTDELLIGRDAVHKYLSGAVYHGFAIHQNHLMLDAPMDFDEPVRIFRLGRGVEFFGCIHEQPGHDGGNGDIVPALALGDVSVAHLGYLTDGIRRHKMLHRNLPLLKRDRERFASRRLGKVLVLRDYYNLGQFYREQTGGNLNDPATRHFRAAIELFGETFADPADKYHGLARPYYEAALRAMGWGFDMEIALGGRQGDMPSTHRAAIKKVRVQSHDELAALVNHELAKAKAQMHPEPIKTDPFPSPEPVAA
jgi:glycosyltransferase involved in cell wall biosynthesis/SAM-dependent methyltransferase